MSKKIQCPTCLGAGRFESAYGWLRIKDIQVRHADDLSVKVSVDTQLEMAMEALGSSLAVLVKPKGCSGSYADSAVYRYLEVAGLVLQITTHERDGEKVRLSGKRVR